MSTYEISKSSLLSLKAEIQRKQAELTKVKAENDIKIEKIKKTPLDIKNKGVENRKLNDISEEEQNLLKLSRSALEAKSKLYDKLSRNAVRDSNQNRRYLVRFDQKNISEKNNLPPSDDEVDIPHIDDEEDRYQLDREEYNTSNPSDQWVEYTDCLGRSRMCLKTDLNHIKVKDDELRKIVDKRKQESQIECPPPEVEQSANCDKGEKIESQPVEPSLISSDMRREQLRQQWEKEEDELLDKTDIHYQNVLFNEARTHGVGYYAFSRDEEERLKQQEALQKLREETEKQQKRAQELKNMRETQLAVRIRAARNRRRARMGLGPEEIEPEPEKLNESEINEKKKEEEENRKRLEEDERKAIEAVRKAHLRPWDIGKEGVKEHVEYTQEEWVEKKREERPTEFAPPGAYNKRDFRGCKSTTGVPSVQSLHFTTKKTPKRPFNSVSYEREDKIESSQTGDDSFSESSLTADKTQSQTFEPVPIINECEGHFDDRSLDDYNKIMQNVHSQALSDSISTRKGVEIAPPSTIEYYGPSNSKRVKNNIHPPNIMDSIEMGLNFIRKQAETKAKLFNR